MLNGAHANVTKCLNVTLKLSEQSKNFMWRALQSKTSRTMHWREDYFPQIIPFTHARSVILDMMLITRCSTTTEGDKSAKNVNKVKKTQRGVIPVFVLVFCTSIILSV